jgi:hypothetical protein
MSAALELIQTVTANGGQMRVEGDSLVIAPDSVALPILHELRQHKREIIWLLGTQACPAQDLEAWREPFVHWLDSTCQRHPRLFGSVSKLHLAYCEWEIANSGVPCTREAFLCFLEELGFLMGNIDGVLLVSGLTFRDDAEAILEAELRENGRQ